MHKNEIVWEIGNGVLISENGEIDARPGTNIIDTVLEACYTASQQLKDIEALQKALKKYIAEVMNIHGTKSITNSEHTLKATKRVSTYTTQDVQALAADLESRLDDLPKEFLLELIYAAKGFEIESIRYDTVRGIVEMYTSVHEKTPSIIITKQEKLPVWHTAAEK